MSALLVPLPLTLLPALVSATGIYSGLCPENVSVKDNFTLEPYMGNWFHRWQSDHNLPFKCPRSQYTSEGPFSFQYRRWNKESKARRRQYTAEIKPGQLIKPRFIFHLRDEPAPQDKEPSYMILETDYFTYAIVFYCFNLKHVGQEAHEEDIEILTRKRIESLKDEEGVKARALEYVSNATGHSRHSFVKNDLTKKDCKV